MAKKKTEQSDLAKNKKAYRDFEILEKYEAGIALKGTEVKSCRQHSVNFTDSYAEILNISAPMKCTSGISAYIQKEMWS